MVQGRFVRLTPADPFSGAPLGPGRRREVPVAPGSRGPVGRVDDDVFPGVSARVDVIVAWVGSDPARARLAVAAELARPSERRSSLLARLGPIAGVAADPRYDDADRGTEALEGGSADDEDEDEPR